MDESKGDWEDDGGWFDNVHKYANQAYDAAGQAYKAAAPVVGKLANQAKKSTMDALHVTKVQSTKMSVFNAGGSLMQLIVEDAPKDEIVEAAKKYVAAKKQMANLIIDAPEGFDVPKNVHENFNSEKRNIERIIHIAVTKRKSPRPRPRRSRRSSNGNNGMQRAEAYRVLEIPEGASPNTIKKAFHAMSRKTHPDRNPGMTSSPFSKVKEAYEALKA
jgi:hypothetical protein